MAKKENKWIEFVEDINESLKLEPPYPIEDEEETIADIVNRQDGDDAFVDEDYLPQNGIGLKDSTVAWLLENDVELPKTWKKRLEKQQALVTPVKQDTPAKKSPEKSAKTAEKKPAKKAPVANRAKNALGHLIGSGAAQLDDLFLAAKGITEAELEKKGFSKSRYKSHYNHLLNDKADLVKVVWKDGKIAAKLLKGE